LLKKLFFLKVLTLNFFTHPHPTHPHPTHPTHPTHPHPTYHFLFNSMDDSSYRVHSKNVTLVYGLDTDQIKLKMHLSQLAGLMIENMTMDAKDSGLEVHISCEKKMDITNPAFWDFEEQRPITLKQKCASENPLPLSTSPIRSKAQRSNSKISLNSQMDGKPTKETKKALAKEAIPNSDEEKKEVLQIETTHKLKRSLGAEDWIQSALRLKQRGPKIRKVLHLLESNIDQREDEGNAIYEHGKGNHKELGAVLQQLIHNPSKEVDLLSIPSEIDRDLVNLEILRESISLGPEGGLKRNEKIVEHEFKKVTEKMSKSQKKITKLSNALEESELQCEQLEDKLAAKKKIINKLISKCDEYAADNDFLISDWRQQQATIENYQIDAQKNIESLKQLKEQLAQCEEAIRDLQHYKERNEKEKTEKREKARLYAMAWREKKQGN